MEAEEIPALGDNLACELDGGRLAAADAKEDAEELGTQEGLGAFDQKERRPGRSGRRPGFDREAYRRRNVVERRVNRLKQ